MPKHTRTSSSAHHRYIGLPHSLAPSATPADMYNARMSMSAYYPDVQTAASLQLQTDQQYAPYMTAAAAAQQQQQQPTVHEAAAQQPASMAPQPRAASTAWSKEDDESLMAARASGLNWSQIQQRYFASKTPNACRKRHERLIERKTADNWNKTDFEKLSMEYMRMRKEIWSPLAAQVGEKWNVVEQKCMSNGLKNLQSAARAGSRRERAERGHQMHGYDDDSGIGGIGLTPVDGLDPSYSSPETTASGGGHSASGVSTGSGSGAGYQMGGHPQLQALGHSANGGGHHASYGYAAHHHQHHHHHPSGPHHGYTSSVASAHSHSSGDASYMAHDQHMRTQRLSSADMGIEAIIHRTTSNSRRM